MGGLRGRRGERVARWEWRALFPAGKPVERMPARTGQRHLELDPAAGPRHARDAALASGFGSSLDHVLQAVAFPVRRRRIKSSAIVFDAYNHSRPFPMNPYKHLARPRMPQRIVDRKSTRLNSSHLGI